MATPFSIVPQVAIGTGVGAAVGVTVQPKLQDYLNQQWKKYPHKPPSAATLALGVAQGQIDPAVAAHWALETGFGPDVFNALIQIANTGPGIAEGFRLWRRQEIDKDGMGRVLKRGGLEQEWIDALLRTIHEPLDPAVIALAMVRGLIDDQGILPVGPPSAVGKIQAFPRFAIDGVAEAEFAGLDKAHLSVMVGNAGRPMSPEAAAEATFKKIIERVDFSRAMAEGDMRNEWADAIFENARPIPSVLDGVQGHLRGWLTVPEMYAETDRHGMAHDDVDLLFKIHGRPPSWHQIWIGLQRGGTYDGPIDMIDPAFLKGLRESDLRPEWYNLLWHSRYNYPSPFVLRQLTQSHAITEADAEQVLKFEGYEPTFAAKIATAWADGAAGVAKADPHVTKAQNSLYAALHSSYVKRESGAGDVTPGMTALGIPVPAQTEILSLWDIERALIHAELSPAQIKKAIRTVTINPATGVAWSHADGVAALLARGYSQADAETFLNE